MSDTILVAIVGFLGVIAGGLVQSVFTRWMAVENFRRDIKRQLYGSFVDAVWLSSTSNSIEGSPERQNEAREFVQLATKIALYGSPEVVKLLAPVMQITDNVVGEDRERLTALISAMRRDVGETAPAGLGDDVHEILFSRVKRGKR